jgi:hypothetical protein
MGGETKFDLKGKVDNHLTENETFLMAIMDMAEVGRGNAEESGDAESNGRFIAIMDLLTMYRERNSTFIKSLYKPLDPKMYPTKTA